MWSTGKYTTNNSAGNNSTHGHVYSYLHEIYRYILRTGKFGYLMCYLTFGHSLLYSVYENWSF